METNEYREQRLASMRELAEMGFEPYGRKYEHTDLKVLRQTFVEGAEARVAGRLMMIRKMGKMNFATIDDGTGTDRTICSGIAQFYENPEELIGKRILFVANFEPRQMMGIESQGMILSAVDFDESLSVVTTTKDVKPGSQVG